MASIVCKFGGSSLSSAEMFRRVREIIHACPDRKYIVLSAPGKRMSGDEKITDLLYRLHECGGVRDQSIFAQIFQRYSSIRDQLVPGFDLESEFAHVRRGIVTKGMDYTVSRGEYICAKLFAAYMDWPFVDAAELFFFSEDGVIDLELSIARIREHLLTMERAIIPGFYGSSPACGIKTFSRGGSDVSGALLAAAIGADRYENWTDVDGLYSADPNLVPEAVRHSEVSLGQMIRIAKAGANVLHPDALLPLMGSGIGTVLKNTLCPCSRGTCIREDYDQIVPCITGRKGLYMITQPSGNVDVLLHPTPVSGGRPVAVISAFGLQDSLLVQIDKRLHPIHIIHMQDHKQIIIEENAYEDSVRKIHSILMERNTI